MYVPTPRSCRPSWRCRTSVDARAYMRLGGLCYNSSGMPPTTINTLLVPEKTVASAKGDGPALDIGGSTSRVFLLTLDITNIIEQEASERQRFPIHPPRRGGGRVRPLAFALTLMQSDVKTNAVGRPPSPPPREGGKMGPCRR